jgi:hypothetical protein
MNEDRWGPDPEYAQYPDHSLHDVPLVVLEAARDVMREAAGLRDVDADLAEPLADAVIMSALPLLRQWLRTQ